jgi:hypothetical protein
MPLVKKCYHCKVMAHRNAGFNIGHPELGHASNLAIIVSISRTFPSIDRNAMMRKEATDFNRW